MPMNRNTESPSNWRRPFSCDARLLTAADLEHSETEERWFSIGIAGNGVLLSVVYLWEGL